MAVNAAPRSRGRKALPATARTGWLGVVAGTLLGGMIMPAMGQEEPVAFPPMAPDEGWSIPWRELPPPREGASAPRELLPPATSAPRHIALPEVPEPTLEQPRLPAIDTPHTPQEETRQPPAEPALGQRVQRLLQEVRQGVEQLRPAAPPATALAPPFAATPEPLISPPMAPMAAPSPPPGGGHPTPPVAQPATPPATLDKGATPPVPSTAEEVPPFPGMTRFHVQLGAFSQRSGARELATRLRREGLPAHIGRRREGEKTLYRVQLGPYRERPEAEAALAHWHQQGHAGGFITER